MVTHTLLLHNCESTGPLCWGSLLQRVAQEKNQATFESEWPHGVTVLIRTTELPEQGSDILSSEWDKGCMDA